jgi:hypothetical protein
MKQAFCSTEDCRLTFFGIAALSVTFFGCLFSKALKMAPPFFGRQRKVTKENSRLRLPLLSGSAFN